jgi:hypothetical protein
MLVNLEMNCARLCEGTQKSIDDRACCEVI